MPETPRLRHGNRNPQNLYLLREDGSETFVGVAMTPEYAEMIVQRFNATTDAEADIRADERRKTIEEMTARLRRAAAGRREYDRGEPPTWAHEALQAEAATLETAVRVLEDPMAMLGLIPSWMWTAEEESRFDEPSPCEVAIREARADERRKVAEEIAAALDEKAAAAMNEAGNQVKAGASSVADRTSRRSGAFSDAAELARQIGEAHDPR